MLGMGPGGTGADGSLCGGTGTAAGPGKRRAAVVHVRQQGLLHPEMS